MYFQFLIEDRSTEILIHHIMKKFKEKYVDKDIFYDTKSFSGIGHLRTTGNLLERKSGNLLNNLHLYLRAFDRSLSGMGQSAIVVVLDNDTRDYKKFQIQLEQVATESIMMSDCIFCIAVKEMEAWLLGDENAIINAYPQAKRKFLKNYEQDGNCETWEVLANMLYPGGLAGLKKKSQNSYSETGKAKCEWADKIGEFMDLNQNNSPSFNRFVSEIQKRIEF